eukprot:3912981-Pyramimonas_sp.AAC.1
MFTVFRSSFLYSFNSSVPPSFSRLLPPSFFLPRPSFFPSSSPAFLLPLLLLALLLLPGHVGSRSLRCSPALSSDGAILEHGSRLNVFFFSTDAGADEEAGNDIHIYI